MNGIHQEFYIISAHISEVDDVENYIRTEWLRRSLNKEDLSYKEVLGVYQEQSEVSFLVVTQDLTLMLELAELYNQECLLLSDKNRECSLIYPGDQPPVYVGKWSEVSSIEAINSGNYTRADGKYYITRKLT